MTIKLAIIDRCPPTKEYPYGRYYIYIENKYVGFAASSSYAEYRAKTFGATHVLHQEVDFSFPPERLPQ